MITPASNKNNMLNIIVYFRVLPDIRDKA